MLKVARFQKHIADELLLHAHETDPLGLTRYTERARMHRVSVLQELGANDPIRSHQVSFRKFSWEWFWWVLVSQRMDVKMMTHVPIPGS